MAVTLRNEAGTHHQVRHESQSALMAVTLRNLPPCNPLGKRRF
jgi:hypothetical protein